MDERPSFDARLQQEVDQRIALLKEHNPGESFDGLAHLPKIYRLLWHLAFDLEVAPHLRHYAASLAFYIHTKIDYISEDSQSEACFVDDLAVAVRGLQDLRIALDEGRIAKYWRAGEDDFAAVLSSAEALLYRHLPARVEEKVNAYLTR